jgi:hypothetical protein
MEKAIFMGWNKMHVANDDMDVIFRFLSFFWSIWIYYLSNSDLQICKYGVFNIKWKKENKLKFILLLFKFMAIVIYSFLFT